MNRTSLTLKHQTQNHILKQLELSAELNREPKDNLSKGNKAEAEAKSTEASKARDEVHPSHFWRSLKFWASSFFRWNLILMVILYVNITLHTEHCWISEKDIDNSNIFLIDIVPKIFLKTFGNYISTLWIWKKNSFKICQRSGHTKKITRNTRYCETPVWFIIDW